VIRGLSPPLLSFIPHSAFIKLFVALSVLEFTAFICHVIITANLIYSKYLTSFGKKVTAVTVQS
jgi:hypothetical protein